MRKVKWLLFTAGLIILGFISYYGYSFYSFANHISQRASDNTALAGRTTTPVKSESNKAYAATEPLTPPKWEGTERINILLLGGDSRGATKNDLPRSDSMMIASIDPVTEQGQLFSILRDTYVKIPGQGEDRINTAITYGGPNLAMKTVGDLTGMPIQYYVYTDFEGFIALVDAIGGIDLDVEKDMKYSDSEDDHKYDINLKKGFQHLDGKTALQYVRFRHDATSDFTRTERQRKFLQAVAVKMQSTTSLLKLPKILSGIEPYIETNLSMSTMLKLASLGFEVKAQGVVSKQLPPNELLQEETVHGAEVLTVNQDKLRTYVQSILDGRDPYEKPAKESDGSSGSSSRSSGSSGSTSATSSSGSGAKKSGTASDKSVSNTRAPAAAVQK